MDTYTPWDVAEIQLNAAIDAYLRGDCIVAITLAYAAEDLYGGPFKPSDAATGEQLAVDPRAHAEDARNLKAVYQRLFKEDLRDVWPVVNETKNWVKHYQTPRTIDADSEAYWAIDRANHNRMLADEKNHLGRGIHPRMTEVDAERRRRERGKVSGESM